MAKVFNMNKYPVVLVARDGNTCQIPVGESKVQDKFCVNVPPTIRIISLDNPVKPVVEAASKKVETNKTAKKGGNN